MNLRDPDVAALFTLALGGRMVCHAPSNRCVEFVRVELGLCLVRWWDPKKQRWMPDDDCTLEKAADLVADVDGTKPSDYSYPQPRSWTSG